jgi:hypothetical protein
MRQMCQPGRSKAGDCAVWLTGRFTVLALCVALLAPASGSGAEKSRRRPPPGDALFSDGKIRTFKIEVAEPALSALQKENRSYVRATITEGGRLFRDVGVHLKGMGSFRPLNEKPSFTLKLDRFTPDQRYLGLSKIMLNNSSQDGTYLAELMATQMFRDAGVPAARVTHAFVEFNGRPFGLYVLVEGMNKEFLQQYFKSTKGNLYEAYLQDIDQKLDLDHGTDSTQADLRRLSEVTKIANPAERWSRLPQVLDIDRYLSHLAVEMFTSHTDGYAMNRNNYRLYHDPTSDRFVFIAHGLDWGFANTGFTIRPPQGSLVTKAVLQTPEGRRLYRERVGQLFTNVFKLDVLTNRVNAAVARLKAAARTPAEATEFENHGAEMRSRLIARAQAISQQLSLPEPSPLNFDPSGVAHLPARWEATKHEGDARQELLHEGDKSLLYIKAGSAGCVASWRRSVFLPGGKYRFVGSARTVEVDPRTDKPSIGAGIRISRDERKNKLVGDVSWTEIEHEFEVMEGGDDKVMVCELRAKKGEVWFDVSSLRIVRR